jgi:hypothetical protein
VGTLVVWVAGMPSTQQPPGTGAGAQAVLVVWMLLWAAIGIALVRQADRQGL